MFSKLLQKPIAYLSIFVLFLSLETGSAAPAVVLAETRSETISGTDFPIKNTEQENKIILAKSSYDEAKATYDKGSFGFFESVGATSALTALTDSSIASYTKKGDVNDATSLENMKAALGSITGQIDSPYFDDTKTSMTYVEKCNYLRAKNSAGELKITDYMMAVAQADCNYSDTVIAHAKAFNVGENIAWNYGSDPFAQWYDKEYALYKNGTTDFSQIGHYKNIIDSSYYYTGFAICTRGSMNNWKTYGQTFQYSTTGTSYTASEYKERFMKYYDSVCNTLKSAEEALNSAEIDAENSAAKPILDDNSSLVYTGSQICPVTVVTKKGDVLKENTDYTIVYSNNIEPGTATATITGLGIYSGTAEISFTIAAKKSETTNTSSGKTVTTSSGEYTIPSETSTTNTSGSTPAITYTAPADKTKTNITVPTTVKINGKKYKVTAIAKNAFKNNKKIKKITIGKNIKTIGAKAFYGCKNLKKVTFKTKVLKKIGNKAFKKIHKKATFKYPKGKKKKYKKLLKKSKSL